jgi:hypothetical protein
MLLVDASYWTSTLFNLMSASAAQSWKSDNFRISAADERPNKDTRVKSREPWKRMFVTSIRDRDGGLEVGRGSYSSFQLKAERRFKRG